MKVQKREVVHVVAAVFAGRIEAVDRFYFQLVGERVKNYLWWVIG